MNRNSIYGEIYAFDNLLTAYKKCRKGHRYQTTALRYHENFEENLVNLQNHLIWNSWEPGKAKFFTVTDPKMREITAPPFKDRVLHHALHQVIEPYFERRFIFDSYACRKGKGVYQAADRLQYFLRKAKRELGNGFYIVKCDIKKYFASIQHSILLTQFTKTIPDQQVCHLFELAIKGYGFDDGIGMPVGALTSQLSGNIMLDPLDHKIKDDWGCKYYLRYMDDFVVLVKDKAAAKLMLANIEREVNALGLTLNPKSGYFPWQRGVDFCGYRAWPTHRLPRKRTVKRAKTRIAKSIKKYQKEQATFKGVRAHIFSFMAYMNRCDAKTTLQCILDESAVTKNAIKHFPL
ncbi:reverse transcriptase/maturase family protein [Thiomicrorhabdus sp.]|uniref:reverse transcriptase/maturase family protein n=1 Tax=Thiomicrorhabdus sp. TaxID=2039724 RepID=UPI0029C89F10|nr:reverse transcriptase/maturase family protein [Thiomicrorhabdus sp.]